jgi:hypothetical protein
MKIENFAGRTPELVLENYFLGHTRASGIFEDRFGNLRRQFEVDITGTVDGDTLTLDEHFIFADGETDRRVWTIRRIDENTYEGTADDVIGTAEGKVFGNALNWTYQVDLAMGDRSLRVRFDDWLFLQPDGVLINRARVTKFGFEIGQVTLFFQRVDDAEAASLHNIYSSAAE